MRGRLLIALLASLAAACRRAPEASESPALAADSLALERTRCFGVCPAYRVSLDAAGVVRFVSSNPGDSTRATDTLSPAAMTFLVAESRRAGLRTLPPEIAKDTTLCPRRATDHPSATVTLFLRDTVVRVVDYHGCRGDADGKLARLRALEARIDSVTGSARWVRPARGKG